MEFNATAKQKDLKSGQSAHVQQKGKRAQRMEKRDM